MTQGTGSCTISLLVEDYGPDLLGRHSAGKQVRQLQSNQDAVILAISYVWQYQSTINLCTSHEVHTLSRRSTIDSISTQYGRPK